MTQLQGKLFACVAVFALFGLAATTASAHGFMGDPSTAVPGRTLEGVQVAGSPYSHAAAHPLRYLRHLQQNQQLWRYYQPMRDQPVRSLGALDIRTNASA